MQKKKYLELDSGVFPTCATCLSTAINYNQIAFLTLYYYLFFVFNPDMNYFFPIHTGRV